MAWRIAHFLLAAAYLVLPVAMLGAGIWRQRRGHRGSVGNVIVAYVCGLAIGMGLNLVYAVGTHARPMVAQVALSAYFATGLLLLLRFFDQGVRAGLRWLLRLREPASEVVSGGWWRGVRMIGGGMIRLTILFAIGLPYVMAAVMTYRPKVLSGDDPRMQSGLNFERVEFRTSDGVRIVGWWMPAMAESGARREQRWDGWGRQTVIVCHGLAASKANELVLARRLVPAGFNVLAFDFRAHGESGGQLATFGALEKRDVLAAVKWVRNSRSAQAQRIFGVGASMGAAALISAAADDSAEGQAIEAVAAYACYDDLYELTRDTTTQYFGKPLDMLLLHVGLPLAAAQAGADLLHYAPAADVKALWPRPLLVIQGEQDEVIDFQRGRGLFDAASQPKFHLFFPQGSHNDVVSSETAARVVAAFFRTARAVPVI